MKRMSQKGSLKHSSLFCLTWNGRPENVRFDFALEYLFIHREISWDLDLSINMDFIYVSCTMCTFIVKLTWQQFHTISFNNFVHGTHFHRVGLSTSGGLLVLKVSGIGILLTLGLWIREVQPVWSSLGKGTVSEDTPCPVRLLWDMARLEGQRLLWLPSEATEDSLSLPGPLTTLLVRYSVI